MTRVYDASNYIPRSNIDGSIDVKVGEQVPMSGVVEVQHQTNGDTSENPMNTGPSRNNPTTSRPLLEIPSYAIVRNVSARPESVPTLITQAEENIINRYILAVKVRFADLIDIVKASAAPDEEKVFAIRELQKACMTTVNAITAPLHPEYY